MIASTGRYKMRRVLKKRARLREIVAQSKSKVFKSS
jgi:hypothetical protein